MDMQVGFINKLDIGEFRQRINEVEHEIDDNQPLLVFDNHDNPRMDARYGDGMHDVDIQRMLATILFASRDTALMYYGDEIGMKTTPPTRKEDVKDPIGMTGWPKEKGRDGERTPMQWDARAQGRIHQRATAMAADPGHATRQSMWQRKSRRRLAAELVQAADRTAPRQSGAADRQD